MSVTGAGGPACRELRQLLGVYVVGAIDPAERALVDQHLGECAACRDELAGLAGLPAMLSRVPATDVARLGRNVVTLPDAAEPSPELLNSLLRRVAVRRRARMWRGVAAAAAAAVIAVGGTSAVIELTGHTSHPPTMEVSSGSNQAMGIAAVVDYAPAQSGGTAMWVQATGIKPGTYCKFWIITHGHRVAAGSWVVTAASYVSPKLWTAASTTSLQAFQITAGGKTLVNIPAT